MDGEIRAAVTLLFMVAIGWVLIRRGQSVLTPSGFTTAWKDANDTRDTTFKPGAFMAIIKGILGAFALAELAGNSGDHGIIGAALAIVVIVMTKSHSFYLVGELAFSLLGFIASVPQVMSLLGLSNQCELGLPVFTRVIMLGAVVVIFVVCTGLTIFSMSSIPLSKGLLQIGMAVFGGLSILTFTINYATLEGNGTKGFLLALVASVVFAIVTPLFPNLVEVASGLGMVGLSLGLISLVYMDASSVIAGTCMETSMNSSILVMFFGISMAGLVIFRGFQSIRGH